MMAENNNVWGEGWGAGGNRCLSHTLTAKQKHERMNPDRLD